MNQGHRGKFGRPGGKLALRIRGQSRRTQSSNGPGSLRWSVEQRERSVPKSKFKRDG